MMDHTLKVWIGDPFTSCDALQFEEGYGHGVPYDVEITAVLHKPLERDIHGHGATDLRAVLNALRAAHKDSHLVIGCDSGNTKRGAENGAIRRIVHRGPARGSAEIKELEDQWTVKIRMHADETRRITSITPERH